MMALIVIFSAAAVAAILGNVAIVTVVVGQVGGESVQEPSNVTLGLLKLHVAPVGKPTQLFALKFTTVPVDPLIELMVKTELVCSPATTGVGFKVVADNPKSAGPRARAR